MVPRFYDNAPRNTFLDAFTFAQVFPYPFNGGADCALIVPTIPSFKWNALYRVGWPCEPQVV